MRSHKDFIDDITGMIVVSVFDGSLCHGQGVESRRVMLEVIDHTLDDAHSALPDQHILLNLFHHLSSSPHHIRVLLDFLTPMSEHTVVRILAITTFIVLADGCLVVVRISHRRDHSLGGVPRQA
jgi:hypothetical protein